MRVYEFTKQHGLINKDVVQLLQKEGFAVTNHMSVLTPEAVKFLEKTYNKKVEAVNPRKEEEQEQIPVQHTQQQKPQAKKAPAPHKQFIQEKKQVSPTATHKDTQQNVRTSYQNTKEDKKLVKKAPEVERKPLTVGELAEASQKPLSEVVLALLRQGVVATKNQMLPEKTVVQLATQFGVKIIDVQKPEAGQELASAAATDTARHQERLPVVVVIGHVDHGKTTLLDYIRKTRVAAKEKGGITQHLGAYEVTTGHGNVVFLDTPGHEAFSMMRVRGIKVADIAILVVGADDGVQPQTIEAIRRAKDAQLPIIVAINKIDKATPSQVEGVKKALTQHGLVAEDWGGDTPCMPISAKLGKGINELLEIVVLQAQLLELKADPQAAPRGYVLESRLEKGRGPVATVICQHGTLRVGDHFVAGSVSGKVSSLVNSQGIRVQEVGPSVPVSVAGFSDLPRVGDAFIVVSAAEAKKMRGRTEDIRAVSATTRQVVPENALNLIVKTDGLSSQEALLASITKISGNTFKQFYVVSTGVGTISDSDIMLAADTKSLVYGLHVKIESSAVALAQKFGVTVKMFDIIYKLLEELQEVAEQGKPVQKVLKKIGEATVLKVFDIKNLGVVAGAQVRSGRFAKEGKLVVWRGKYKVGEGAISSLQRDRKSVKEVHTGFECAFMIDKFTDWAVDDRVECFLEVPA